MRRNRNTPNVILWCRDVYSARSIVRPKGNNRLSYSIFRYTEYILYIDFRRSYHSTVYGYFRIAVMRSAELSQNWTLTVHEIPSARLTIQIICINCIYNISLMGSRVVTFIENTVHELIFSERHSFFQIERE